MKDHDDRELSTRVVLKADTISNPITAHVDELELILPAIISSGITSGIGDWWQSTQLPKVSNIIEGGVDLAIDVTASLPKRVEAAPDVIKTGGGGDFGGGGATASWTDDLLAQVGSTISNVHKVTAGVLSSSVDTAGTVCVAVGDTVSSISSGLGDAACVVGDGIGSVASGIGDVASGIVDAAGSIDP